MISKPKMRELCVRGAFSIGAYFCDNSGNVYSRRTNRGQLRNPPKKLKTYIGINGYRVTNIRCSFTGLTFTVPVHQLIWLYFNNVFSGEIGHINHKDLNKLNNSLKNLELISQAENNRHSARFRKTNKGRVNFKTKLNRNSVITIRQMFEDNYSDSFIAKRFGVSRTAISAVRNGRNWGYVK